MAGHSLPGADLQPVLERAFTAVAAETARRQPLPALAGGAAKEPPWRMVQPQRSRGARRQAGVPAVVARFRLAVALAVNLWRAWEELAGRTRPPLQGRALREPMAYRLASLEQAVAVAAELLVPLRLELAESVEIWAAVAAVLDRRSQPELAEQAEPVVLAAFAFMLGNIREKK